MRALSPPQTLHRCSNVPFLVLSNRNCHRQQSSKTSQKKTSEGPLSIPLKGLSPEEENYVRSQTQLCLTSQPTPLLNRQEELNKLYKKAGTKVNHSHLIDPILRVYLPLQLRHANLRCPTVLSRCLSMADSFKVEKRDRVAFLAFCNQHAEPATNRR